MRFFDRKEKKTRDGTIRKKGEGGRTSEAAAGGVGSKCITGGQRTRTLPKKKETGKDRGNYDGRTDR